MKNLSKKNKIIYAIAFLIIIAGCIVFFTKGFVFDMKYAKRDQIVLSNKTGFDTSKIKEISQDVLSGKEIEVREVEYFKNIVAISSREITEEEKGKIIEKVNQEYGLDISTDNVKIQNIEQTRIKDMLKPYILPIIITFALSLLYFLIRYRKLGVKEIFKEGILPILVELEFFSIIAITRIPFGDITIAIALALYAVTLVVIASNFERKADEISEQAKNK